MCVSQSLRYSVKTAKQFVEIWQRVKATSSFRQVKGVAKFSQTTEL